MRKLLCFMVLLVSAVLLSACGGLGVSQKEPAWLNEEVEIAQIFKVKANSYRYSNEFTIFNSNGEEVVLTSTDKTHFIIVNVTIVKKTENTAEYKFRTDHFKLKDHSGVLGINILVDAINNIKNPDIELGDVILDEMTRFNTVQAKKDYLWFDTVIASENADDIFIKTFEIAFEVSNEVKVEEDIVILEIDFSWFKYGADISLLERPSRS